MPLRWGLMMSDAVIIALGILLASPWFVLLLAIAHQLDKKKEP